MANKTMKTLTVGSNTYEVVDEAARVGIEDLKVEVANAGSIDINLNGSVEGEANYLKPQSPLQHKDGDYFYPLTTVDQVILDDNTRLDDAINKLDLDKPTMTTCTVTLTATDWVNNSLTIAVNGVTKDNTVIVGSNINNNDVYIENKIFCIAQDEGILTFSCETIPTMNLQVNIIILD